LQYVSTRGSASKLGFEDVLLAGLARDGGLYVPETWPQFSAPQIGDLAGRPYEEQVVTLISPFVGDAIAADDLSAMVHDAYATFGHRTVAPLSQLGPDLWLLELFHGPTLAFKDVAMQLLARMMDHALARRGERATIVGATSGDTGAAAVEAFRGREATDLFILHPNGRVSDVQRRQMTTVHDERVHNIAIDGTFDDCQAIVKGLFNDLAFRDAMRLGGVNSINWARVMAQIVYYFSSAVALGAPQRPVTFVVPTGNFGDIFAGYGAKRMGLPVDRLVIATNVNDILARFLSSGRYEIGAVEATMSPSMDIQVSSNFERILFDACGGDGDRIAQLMGDLSTSGAFEVNTNAVLSHIRGDFEAGRTDEAQTLAEIGATFGETGMLVDPHTAVGLAVARRRDWAGDAPVVALATAHPAKFPDAVQRACGQVPELPARLADLYEREERFTVLPNDLDAVRAHIRSRSPIA
jgi:threonine synthase